MLNRKHHTSDPFPTQCEVGRCTTPPEEWFAVDECTFDVCSSHELELRAGEPHAVVEGEVLVGRDCTGEILGVRHTRTAASETTVIRLGHRGVVHQEVSLDSPADLRTALEALRGGKTRYPNGWNSEDYRPSG